MSEACNLLNCYLPTVLQIKIRCVKLLILLKSVSIYGRAILSNKVLLLTNEKKLKVSTVRSRQDF